jgi:uncharacterized protein YlxP (DUF503 family)
MQSLKEKRSVLNSLKQRLKNGHNIAVSEVDFQEQRQRTALGISTVSLRQSDAEKMYNAIYNQISTFYPVQISRAEKNYF